MKFGDIQSLMQLSAAVNLAYFSFKEIRTLPFTANKRHVADVLAYVASIEDLYRRHLGEVSDRMTLDERYLQSRLEWLLGEISVHKTNLVNYASNELELDATKYDTFIGNASLFTGAFAFCALVWCSISAGTFLPLPAFAVILAVSYFAPTAAIFINWQYKSIAEASLPDIKAIRGKVAPYQALYYSEIQPKVLAVKAARAPVA